MQIDINQMLQAYGLDTEFPTKWKDSRYTNALSTIGKESSNSGAVVEELLSTFTTKSTTPNDEPDPLGFSTSIMNQLQNKQLTNEDRSFYLPSSTNFDTKRFLNDVHTHTSIQDLKIGLHNLKEKIKLNESGLRQMVDTDYENYVNTKRKLDDVINMLHNTGVRKETQYGFNQLEQKLNAATNQLSLCARPMDGFNMEKQSLNNSLKAIDQYRSVLELPQLLNKFYLENDHSQFVRELKRGERLIKNLNKSSSEVKLGNLIQQRVLLVKEKYSQSLNKQLLKTDADGAYAPLLKRLMDLNVKGNFASEWLNHNIQLFSNEIDIVFEEIESIVKRNADDSNLSMRKLDLVTYLPLLMPVGECNVYIVSDQLDEFDHIDTEECIGQWEQIMVKFVNLNAILNRASVFYREFLLLTKSSSSISPNEVDVLTKKCHMLVEKTGELVVKSISTLSKNEIQYCSLIPLNANSLSASKYLGQILELLTNSNDQISSMLDEQTNPLQTAITTLKQQFVKALCECWVRDSMEIGKIQTWTQNKEHNFPAYFQLYHNLMIEKIRFLMDSNRGGPSTNDTVKHLVNVFPTALSVSIKSVELTLTQTANQSNQSLDEEMMLKLQPQQPSQDSKLLVTLNSLETLRDSKLEQIYDQFETAIMQQKYTNAIRDEVSYEVNTIATHLFDIYIRKKKARLSEVLHKEFMRLVPLWSTKEMEVVQVSSHVYECLMVLVETHALFMESCPQLTRRAILELYSHLLTNISELLRNELDTLTRFGTLQNVADLEFMRWAMSQFPETNDLCRRIFDDIKNLSISDDIWQQQQGGARSFVLKVLDVSIKNSHFEFNCFKSMAQN